MNDFLRRTATIKSLQEYGFNRFVFFFIALLSLSIAMIGPKPAQAQAEPQVNEDLIIYLIENEDYNASLQPLIQQNMKTIKKSCKQIGSPIRQLPKEYEPVSFPAKQANDPPSTPARGQWKDSFKVIACNKTYIFNFFATASTQTLPLILPLVNGQTIIDPIYQLQAEETSEEELQKTFPEHCSQGGHVMVEDTSFLGYIQANNTIGKTNMRKGWFEQWDIWYCRETKRARVAILQDETGSFTIMAKAQK